MKTYSESGDLWFEKTDEGKVRFGITFSLAKELGDIVFLQYPESGKAVKKGEELLALESSKALMEVTAPYNMVVSDRNEAVSTDFSDILKDPEGSGWLGFIESF